MKTHFTLLLAVLILFPLVSISQDIIYKKNNDSIICMIREVGTEDIKYNDPEYSDKILFSIDKDKVARLMFSDGHELIIQTELTNPENYIDDRKRAIKIDFISPLTGNTTISYEHSIKPGRSFEGSVGLIGLGLDPGDNNPLGMFVQFGMKFIKSPDFYFSRMRYAHLLKGGYIKPEVSFGAYGIDTDYYYSENERETVVTGAVMVNFGKQWVFDNVMLFDIYVGVGYGFSTRDHYDDLEYNFGYVTGPPQFPIAMQAGINIGYLLK